MKTILLIEDNADILDNLIEGLEMEGYRIISAMDGKQGLRLAATVNPDLIICDVLMPEMNGLDVLRLIKKTPLINRIPFIFSSSMSEKIDRSDALKLGADDYIVKPFGLEPLLEMASQWLETGRKL